MTYTFSGSELYLFVALQGGTTLLGVRDPFYGWLTEEIAEELQHIRSSLGERGYLLLENGGTTITPEFASLMAALATPQVALMVNRSRSDGSFEERAYHIDSHTVARLIPVADVYHLDSLDQNALAGDIWQWWGTHDQQAAPGTPFKLLQTTLFAARDAAQTHQDAAALLRAANASNETAEALAEALASPHTNGSFAVLRRVPSGWATSGCAVLAGPAGLWHLRTFEQNDEAWIEVAPISATELLPRIDRLVRTAIDASAT